MFAKAKLVELLACLAMLSSAACIPHNEAGNPIDNPPPDGGIPTTTIGPDPLAVMAGCVTANPDDFTIANMAQLWCQKPTNGQGNCSTCHNQGQQGMLMTCNATVALHGMQTEAFAHTYVIGLTRKDGTTDFGPDIQKFLDILNLPGSNHPIFVEYDPKNPNADPAFAALMQWSQLLHADLAAGRCGPAAYVTQ
jgi:hypothetical protein